MIFPNSAPNIVYYITLKSFLPRPRNCDREVRTRVFFFSPRFKTSAKKGSGRVLPTLRAFLVLTDYRSEYQVWRSITSSRYHATYPIAYWLIMLLSMNHDWYNLKFWIMIKPFSNPNKNTGSCPQPDETVITFGQESWLVPPLSASNGSYHTQPTPEVEDIIIRRIQQMWTLTHESWFIL